MMFFVKHLGIDYGTTYVGLALSDDAGVLAFPLEVVRNSASLARDIEAVAVRERVGRVVIGESRTEAGEENPVTRPIHVFGQKLQRRVSVPIDYEAEMFTSREAARPIISRRGATTRPSRHRATRAGRQDASAAALILQRYLDRNRGNPHKDHGVAR